MTKQQFRYLAEADGLEVFRGPPLQFPRLAGCMPFRPDRCAATAWLGSPSDARASRGDRAGFSAEF